MMTNASQAPVTHFADDSLLIKGPDLHNLQPGNLVGFQDWYSLPQADRDRIDAELRSRGLKLLPFDEEQFHVTCYDTSPKVRAISPIPEGPLAEISPVERLELPDMALTPPDSMKLIVQLHGGSEPRTASAVPGAVTFGMQRELATHIAIELNRSVLRTEHRHHWYVVAYTNRSNRQGGFCVVRIVRPLNWNPCSEYDTPPSAETGMMNAASRMEAIRFNRLQLASGGPVKFWQLHVKPLEYPKAALRDELNEVEAAVIALAAEGLAGHMHVQRARNGELSLQFNGSTSSITWNPEKETVADLARHFRNLAKRFQNAATKLDGRECHSQRSHAACDPEQRTSDPDHWIR